MRSAGRLRLRRHAHRRAPLQARPHEREAPRLGARGDPHSGGGRLDPVPDPEPGLPLRRLLERHRRAHREVRSRDRKPNPKCRFPITGTASISCPDFHGNRCLVATTCWTLPDHPLRLRRRRRTRSRRASSTPTSPIPASITLVTEEVEVPGHDGAMIPLSIIHQKGIPMDGSNSCILTGYGAYGISSTPSFSSCARSRSTASSSRSPIRAAASEKGEAWYKAGYKTTKPNTWKDFISCAEYLVKKGYTSKEKLAGTGTSAGGILISRAITERPDLFAAAVCNVGVANAMRVEFSPERPGQHRLSSAPSTTRSKRPALYEMDGVQHVQKGVKYPAAHGRRRLERPSRVPVGARQVRGGDAGGERLRQAGAHEDQLRQRPFHRGEARSPSRTSRASTRSCSGRRVTRSSSRRHRNLDPPIGHDRSLATAVMRSRGHPRARPPARHPSPTPPGAALCPRRRAARTAVGVGRRARAHADRIAGRRCRSPSRRFFRPTPATTAYGSPSWARRTRRG